MNKRTLIIGGVMILIVTVLGFAYFSGNSKTSPNPGVNTVDKATVFNTGTLLERGVTSEQLTNLEEVLSQYFNSQGKVPNQVDFNTIQRSAPDPKISTPFTQLTFIVQPDGKPAYKAKVDAFSSSEIRLYLYNLGGSELLYDSQNVGGSSN